MEDLKTGWHLGSNNCSAARQSRLSPTSRYCASRNQQNNGFRRNRYSTNVMHDEPAAKRPRLEQSTGRHRQPQAADASQLSEVALPRPSFTVPAQSRESGQLHSSGTGVFAGEACSSPRMPTWSSSVGTGIFEGGGYGSPALLRAVEAAEGSSKLKARKKKLRQELGEWQIPPGAAEAYRSKGLEQLYPWQAAAMESGEAGNNLLYCAPTSGGKTLVAELLMIRRLIATKEAAARRFGRPKLAFKKALVVLPYVALVREKSQHLQEVLSPLGCTVKGYTGSDDASGTPLADLGEAVAVCTIEKANVTINRMVQNDRLQKLCCVVVDELHMVADPQRGLALELTLIKLLQSPAGRGIQIIGMSATMGGLERLASWLRAALFVTNFRPVPLTEHVVFEGVVYIKETSENSSAPVRELRQLPASTPNDRERLLPLIAETVVEGSPVLIFCCSRTQTQSTAAMIAEALPTFLPQPTSVDTAANRRALVEQLRAAMQDFSDPPLEKLLSAGVAYHHAGMSAQERAAVESGYRSGVIQVLTATSTLAAGINLPAKRVILRSLRQGVGDVSREQYLQMVGRAGRAGQAASGESFLIGSGPAFSQAGEWAKVCGLLEAPVPCLTSSLLPSTAQDQPGDVEFTNRDTGELQRLVLESIANGSMAEPKEELSHLMRCTLISHQVPSSVAHAAVRAALKALREAGLLSFRTVGETSCTEWVVTDMGRAIYESSLPIQVGIELYASLKHANEAGLVLEETLDQCVHLIFLLLVQEHPFRISNWSLWLRVFESLSPAKCAAAALLGINEAYICKRQSGSGSAVEVTARHERFAAALALAEMISGQAARTVAAKWGRLNDLSERGLEVGALQKLQDSLAKWAAMAANLCGAKWGRMGHLLNTLSAEAAAGTCPELRPLLKIDSISAAQARLLFAAGLATPGLVAAAGEDAVTKALAVGVRRRAPTEAHAVMKVGRTGASGTNALVARESRGILAGAKRAITQQALELLDQAGLEGMEPSSPGFTGGTGEWRASDAQAFKASTHAFRRALAACKRHVTVSLYGPEADVEQLRNSLEELRRQSHLHMCVVKATPSAIGRQGSGQVLGVAVSAGSDAVYIDLGKPGDGSACAELAWHFLGQVMLSAAVRKVLWDVPEQVPCLIAGGMPFTGAGVEDAKAASLMLWPDLRADEVTPAQVHARLCLPGLSLPLLHCQDVLEACRTVAQLSAMSSVLVGLLLGQGSMQAYRRIEVPLQMAVTAAHLHDVWLMAPQLSGGRPRAVTWAEAASAACQDAPAAANPLQLPCSGNGLLKLQLMVDGAALQPAVGRSFAATVPALGVAVLATLCGDVRLEQAAARPDPFSFLAERWGRDKSPELVMTLLECIAEGWGPTQLAEQTMLESGVAMRLLKDFIAKLLPALEDFLARQWEEADKQGFAKCLTESRLYLPRNEKSARVISDARRAAQAFVVSGAVSSFRKALLVEARRLLAAGCSANDGQVKRDNVESGSTQLGPLSPRAAWEAGIGPGSAESGGSWQGSRAGSQCSAAADFESESTVVVLSGGDSMLVCCPCIGQPSVLQGLLQQALATLRVGAVRLSVTPHVYVNRLCRTSAC